MNHERQRKKALDSIAGSGSSSQPAAETGMAAVTQVSFLPGKPTHIYMNTCAHAHTHTHTCVYLGLIFSWKRS
jgi:hypothetical protein